MTSLAQRRTDAEARHAALRAQRGADALDGRKVNAAAISAVEAELEAIADAEVEETRRERAAASHERKSRRAEQVERLKELDRKRTEALQTAEDGCRQLVAGLKDALAFNAQMASEFREVIGGVPLPCQPIAAAGRLSSRLSAVMRSIKPGPAGGRFGHIEWPNTMNQADESWTCAESKVLSPYLSKL